MTARVCCDCGGGSRSRSVAITTVEQRLSQRHERNATNWAPTVSSAAASSNVDSDSDASVGSSDVVVHYYGEHKLLRFTFGTRLTFGHTANAVLGLLSVGTLGALSS